MRCDAMQSGRIVSNFKRSFCPSYDSVNKLVFYQIRRYHFPNTAILNQAWSEVGHRIVMKEEENAYETYFGNLNNKHQLGMRYIRGELMSSCVGDFAVCVFSE